MPHSSFRVSLPASIPTEQRDALLQVLRPYAQVQSTTTRSVSPTEIQEILQAVMRDVVVVSGAVSAAAAAGSAVIKFLNDLRQWRDTVRSRGVRPDVELEHRQRRINLDTAGDAELEQWVRSLFEDSAGG